MPGYRCRHEILTLNRISMAGPQSPYPMSDSRQAEKSPPYFKKFLRRQAFLHGLAIGLMV
jgi:hypothetical protein